MIKTFKFILLSIISTICFGNNDSLYKKIDTTKTIIISNPDVINSIDTFLISSTLLDPEEDIFTPSFFSVSPGLYKFPILLNLEDYGWISQNVMLIYNNIQFKTDTIPSTVAKYDNAYTTAHWFTARFDRSIGKSKLSARLNRNFQKNDIYSNSIGKRFNFSIGSELPFHKNYRITFSYFRNQAEIEENGGFQNADSLLFVDELNETTLNSNLNSALNTIFLQKTSILQELRIHPNIKLNFTSEYEANKYSFELLEEDIDANFFSKTYLDTTETFDSIGFRKLIIQPVIKFGNTNKKKRKSIVRAGIHKEINDKNILNNSYALSSLNMNFGETPVSISGKYHFENVWKGNFSISGSTNLMFKKETIDTIKYLSHLFLQINIKNQLPSYLFLNYFSNHFEWESNFNPTQKIKIDAKLNLKKLSSIVELEVQNVSNYIYLDENSLPAQNNENITAGKVSLKKQWSTQYIKLYSGLGFQYSSSDLIRIPSFYTRSSLVYEFKLRKVPFNLGSTISLFSKYLGLNYNPAIRHYYLGKQIVGGTPVVDFFLASRLGPADIYIKYDNTFYSLNRSLLIGENYPITNSFLRLGLKWNLTN